MFLGNFVAQYQSLYKDIYPQPPDIWHSAMTRKAVMELCAPLEGCSTVLDVGCGEGSAQDIFLQIGLSYTGIGLGKDIEIGKKKKYNVFEMDFNFTDFPSGSFDIIFSRHSLEHSVMPTIALMEWRRVANKYLCLVLPNPEYWQWGGLNHYSVMSLPQIHYLLERTGWKFILENCDKYEFRILAKKD